MLSEMEPSEAAVDDDDALSNWATRTRAGPIRVNWRVQLQISHLPEQKFWLWTPARIEDLGTENLWGHRRRVLAKAPGESYEPGPSKPVWPLQRSAGNPKRRPDDAREMAAMLMPARTNLSYP
jgi:hypothetical protein